MDFLKAEIAGKRKALDADTSRPNKYMRKGDIAKMKEAEERKQREEVERSARKESETKAAEKAKAKVCKLTECRFNELLNFPCSSSSRSINHRQAVQRRQAAQ